MAGTLIKGQRVRLMFHPFCEGEIIEVDAPLTFQGATLSGQRYRVKWDNEEDGISGWLKDGDLSWSDTKKTPLRCHCCDLPWGYIQNGVLIVQSRHHGETHTNVIAISELTKT